MCQDPKMQVRKRKRVLGLWVTCQRLVQQMFDYEFNEFREHIDLEHDISGEPLEYQYYFEDPQFQDDNESEESSDEMETLLESDEYWEDLYPETEIDYQYPDARVSDVLCSCNLKLGKCNSIDHPKLLVEESFLFIEGWGLGKYAGRKGKMGNFIYDYKYRNYLNDEKAYKNRNELANKMNSYIEYFFNKHWEIGKLPFDSIYAIPGSTGKFPSIANEIAEYFESKGLRKYPEFIEVDYSFSSALKNNQMHKYEKDKLMQNKFHRNVEVRLPLASSVLFIDDVVSTGATISRAAKILKNARPETRIYFLTVAYI